MATWTVTVVAAGVVTAPVAGSSTAAGGCSEAGTSAKVPPATLFCSWYRVVVPVAEPFHFSVTGTVVVTVVAARARVKPVGAAGAAASVPVPVRVIVW